MKSLLAAVIALFIGIGYSSVSNITSDTTSATNLRSFQADEPPATGNDSEDTSERGLMCRLFGYFC